MSDQNGAAISRTVVDAHNRAMIETLRTAGWLTNPQVEDAMRAVPRHRFAPDRGWLSPDRGAGPTVRSVWTPAFRPGHGMQKAPRLPWCC